MKYWEFFRLLGNLQLSWVSIYEYGKEWLLLQSPPTQSQVFNPWMLWLQNPSAAMTVKFSGDDPLLAIWRSCHLYIRFPNVLNACQNLLEYFCPAVLSLQLILGCLKSPVRAKAYKGEVFPVTNTNATANFLFLLLVFSSLPSFPSPAACGMKLHCFCQKPPKIVLGRLCWFPANPDHWLVLVSEAWAHWHGNAW